ncbi:MAG: hypothetical protein ACLFV4_06945 [Candidatus Hydrogenedentota bacterium]
MIRFECPHCAYRFEVEDRLAGHSGWCANCKNVISVPAADGTPSFEELPDDEKLETLRHVLRQAVQRLEKAEARVRRLDRRLQRAKEQAAQDPEANTRELEASRKRLEEAEAEIRRLNAELASDQAGGDFDNAAFEALEAEAARLEHELDEERSARQEAEKALAKAKEQIRENEGWRSRYSALQSEYDELSGELTAGRERLETERLRHSETTATLKDARQTIEQLRRKLQAAQTELAEEKQRSEEQQNAAVRLESELKKKDGRIQSLEAERQRLAGVSEDAADLHQAWRQKEQEVAELRATLEATREERDNALRLIDGLDGKLQRLQAALERADSARLKREELATDSHAAKEAPPSAEGEPAQEKTEENTLFPEVVDQRRDPAPRELLDSLLRFMQSG